MAPVSLLDQEPLVDPAPAAWGASATAVEVRRPQGRRDSDAQRLDWEGGRANPTSSALAFARVMLHSASELEGGDDGRVVGLGELAVVGKAADLYVQQLIVISAPPIVGETIAGHEHVAEQLRATLVEQV